MPWRPRPRAAVVLLLSAGALTAATAGLRTRSAAAPHELLNNTLTRDEHGCAGVSTALWHPLSGLDYTGRLRFTLPAHFGGAIALYVGDSLPLDIEAATAADVPVAIHQERLLAGTAGVLLPPDYWIEDGTPLESPRHVSRLTIDASGEHDRTVILSLGRRAPRVLARLVNYPARVNVAVCAEAVREGEVYFATGWHGRETMADVGEVRWMREHGALLVPSPDGAAARIRFAVRPASPSQAGLPAELRVRVNDVFDLPPIHLDTDLKDYTIEVPDTAWVPGTNEILFHVSRTITTGGRVRGLALASLHVQ